MYREVSREWVCAFEGSTPACYGGIRGSHGGSDSEVPGTSATGYECTGTDRGDALGRQVRILRNGRVRIDEEDEDDPSGVVTTQPMSFRDLDAQRR